MADDNKLNTENMKEKIEAAIRETLVIENKQSLNIAVDKIMKIIAESETKRCSCGRELQITEYCNICDNDN